MPVVFETERLIIRRWEPDRDADDAYAMYSDPEVIRLLGRAPAIVASPEIQREYLEKRIAYYTERNDGTGVWALEEKSTGQVVGALLVKHLPDGEGTPTEDLEVGWHLRRSAWGKGYATEAGRVGIDYAHGQLGAPVVFAVVKKDNARSIAVTHRLGMKPLGSTDKYYGVTLELFEALRCR